MCVCLVWDIFYAFLNLRDKYIWEKNMMPPAWIGWYAMKWNNVEVETAICHIIEIEMPPNFSETRESYINLMSYNLGGYVIVHVLWFKEMMFFYEYSLFVI